MAASTSLLLIRRCCRLEASVPGECYQMLCGFPCLVSWTDGEQAAPDQELSLSPRPRRKDQKVTRVSNSVKSFSGYGPCALAVTDCWEDPKSGMDMALASMIVRSSSTMIFVWIAGRSRCSFGHERARMPSHIEWAEMGSKQRTMGAHRLLAGRSTSFGIFQRGETNLKCGGHYSVNTSLTRQREMLAC